eukprot:5112773-Pleurochrysis_carterae.AAC.1
MCAKRKAGVGAFEANGWGTSSRPAEVGDKCVRIGEQVRTVACKQEILFNPLTALEVESAEVEQRVLVLRLRPSVNQLAMPIEKARPRRMARLTREWGRGRGGRCGRGSCAVSELARARRLPCNNEQNVPRSRWDFKTTQPSAAALGFAAPVDHQRAAKLAISSRLLIASLLPVLGAKAWNWLKYPRAHGPHVLFRAHLGSLRRWSPRCKTRTSSCLT